MFDKVFFCIILEYLKGFNMQTITFNSFQLVIHTTKMCNFLISNEDFADVCFVFEKLIDMTRNLNPSILIEDKHYINIENKIFWTKEGIVRVCILLSNTEALDFANFIEDYEDFIIVEKRKSESLTLHSDFLDELKENNKI